MIRAALARIAGVGEGHRLQTVLTAFVVGLAILAIATLIALARTLSAEVDQMREARSDNRTWLVSQLEVDLARLEAALRHVSAGGPRDEAAKRLDILISRTTLLDAAALRLDGDDEGMALVAAVDDGAARLAAVIDAWPPQPGPVEVDAALDAALSLWPAVRGLSLAVLARAVALERAERDSARGQLGRLVSLAVLLVILLSGVVLVVADLYRDLMRRAQIARRIGSNLEKTIEAARDAVVVCDAGGRIRSFNAAAERMFGMTRSRAIGADAAALLLRQADPGGIAAFAAPEVPGAAGALVTGQRADGTAFPLEVSRVTDTDTDGLAVHFVTLRDVSDRLAAEADLRAARDAALESAEMRARFVAVMSHELRTPLNGVIAAIDLMGKSPIPAAQRRLLGLAGTSAQTALRLIEDLLDLHRHEGTGVAEQPAVFDPAGVLREAVAVSRGPAEQRGNRLILDLPDPPAVPGSVQGLPRSFERAALNLVSNAVKFTRDGTITVGLRADPPDPSGRIRLTVTVADTGPGIAPEHHARVFDDFETLDTSPAAGSGLGLGIARRAVRAMGGVLTLDSAPGRGAVFRFTALVDPAAAPAPCGQTACAADLPAAPPMSILLAEDNAINRYLMQEMLRRLGHSVVAVADGQAAVAAAAAQLFDALVVDLAMTGLDGLRMIGAVRAGGGPSRHAPALIVTAQVAPLPPLPPSGEPRIAVAAKPLRLAALERALARLVAPPDDPLLDRAVIEDARHLLGAPQQAALFARFAADLEEELMRDDLSDAARHSAAGAAAILGARRLHRLLTTRGDRDAIRAALAATREAFAALARPRDAPATGTAGA